MAKISLTQLLPDNLRGNLPTIEELEEELERVDMEEEE